MLQLFLDQSHRELAERARRFAAAEIAPFAASWEEAEEFPRELYRRAGQAGLLAVGYAADVGGAGGDLFHRLVVAEELIRGTSVGTAVALCSHAVALPALIAHGGDDLRREFVAPTLRGELVPALAVTEPGGGSDVAGLACRAVDAGDHYVVDGSKMFVTSGTRADFMTTAVRTGRPGVLGLSLLVIERATPGVEVVRKLKKMGWRASDTAEIRFHGCRVSKNRRVGAEGTGFASLMANFVDERLLLATYCVAIARLAIEETERYVARRHAFGRPVVGFQVVRHRLAEMATREHAARAFLATVAEAHRRGEEVTVSAAMVKNHAAEACVAICDAAVQLHGGVGYTRDSLVERLYRDARLFPIGGGTTEVMRELIAQGRGYDGSGPP